MCAPHPGRRLLAARPAPRSSVGKLAETQTLAVIYCGSGPVPGPFHRARSDLGSARPASRLRLIIAHMGMPEYADFLDLAGRYDSVHLDTTMAFTDFANDRMPLPASLTSRLADLGNKILFGSDFPQHLHIHSRR